MTRFFCNLDNDTERDCSFALIFIFELLADIFFPGNLKDLLNKLGSQLVTTFKNSITYPISFK